MSIFYDFTFGMVTAIIISTFENGNFTMLQDTFSHATNNFCNGNDKLHIFSTDQIEIEYVTEVL